MAKQAGFTSTVSAGYTDTFAAMQGDINLVEQNFKATLKRDVLQSNHAM